MQHAKHLDEIVIKKCMQQIVTEWRWRIKNLARQRNKNRQNMENFPRARDFKNIENARAKPARQILERSQTSTEFCCRTDLLLHYCHQYLSFLLYAVKLFVVNIK